ncbi:unnamed protein product [Diabrotica balteata]|uniref:E3 ubiquitin-protein ligase APD1-4 middle domain-containing protein n=1 Tax=Diabrotica balteata TaxID=107213 RepID=A0A9N9T244_DIABA|nr:unnamed protein product [Diabrotica balteata]
MREESIYEFPVLQNSSLYQRSISTNPWILPVKVIKLFVLGILVPCLLITIPLYLRYRVYSHQMYPLAMSDMRLIDNKVSTTWCQKQRVSVNATFNAFLLSKTPEMSTDKKPMSMVRELSLEDDTKEYWGFYLLKGTSVTVSTCVRWPGASLIMIRGHKHLHECAYIGDNSSEELEEQMEAIREKAFIDSDEKKADQPANNPDEMKRHRPEVKFHSVMQQNYSKRLEQSIDNIEVTDWKDMRAVLLALQEKSKNFKSKLPQQKQQHVHRNSTIALDETKNFKIDKPKNQTSSEEALDDIMSRLTKMGEKGTKVLEKVNNKYMNKPKDHVFDMKARHYSKPAVIFENVDQARKKRELVLEQALANNEDDEEHDLAIEEEFHPDGIADHRGTFNETSLNDMSNSEFWSSFSSSEEALLNCAGLILSLPLLPHRKCVREYVDEESSRDNTISYKVPLNGYYFFVFNSENEVQTNYVRVKFDIEKTVYNISNPVAKCINASETCTVDLNFFSSEKLVMELPLVDNESLFNEEFIVLSECEPRSSVYAVFVILVPILVIFFAFS